MEHNLSIIGKPLFKILDYPEKYLWANTTAYFAGASVKKKKA
jgi:hypothetical protein